MRIHILENEAQLTNTKRKLQLLEDQAERSLARNDQSDAGRLSYQSLMSFAKQLRDEIDLYERSRNSPRQKRPVVAVSAESA